jgi:predicted DNA-binding transcriptional regulator YafY
MPTADQRSLATDGDVAEDARGLEEKLQAAIKAASTVELVYADARGRVTVRPVRPLRLEECRRRQLLVAYCELRRDERHFRLDRIIGVQPSAGRSAGCVDPEPLPFPDEN